MAPLAHPSPPEAALSEPLQPGTRVGNYRLLRLLGKGGMGAVYEAVHLYIERRAAIKVLHAQLSSNSEFRTRFLNEARAVNLIKHPGLVEVYEFGLLDDGTAYIVMEFLHGESLEQHIKRHPQGLGREALPIAGEIAQAMVAAHEKQIVHRDLKPANIMLVAQESGRNKGDEPRIKVLDFGIAKMSQEVEGSLRTETGATIGTPAYMAPEQCLSAPNVDGKADVYALGIILYELLSGRLPFAAQHSFDFMAAHVRSEPQPIAQLLPELPPEVANLVHSMLVKDPELRPRMETVASLLQELTAAGAALWVAEPLHATELGSLGRQQLGHAATLSQPARLSRDRIEVVATTPGLAGGRVSRELAHLGSLPSSQISGGARSSPGISRSGSRSLSPGSAQDRSDRAAPVEGLASSQLLPVSDVAPKNATRPAPLWFAGSLLFAIALGSSLWLALRARDSSPGSAVFPTGNGAAKPAAVRTVRWLLRTQPSGAEVVRSDGLVIGSTPFQLVRPADAGESQITLRLSGYAAKSVVLSHSTDVETDIALHAQPAERKSADPEPRSDESSHKRAESRKGEGKAGGKPVRKTAGKGPAKKANDVQLLMD
jgi:serine/threonine protein kinase